MTKIAILGENASDSGVSSVKIFENVEFGQLDAILLDGEPWFIAKEVAQILEYTNPSKAIADHVDNEDCKVFGIQGFERFVISLALEG